MSAWPLPPLQSHPCGYILRAQCSCFKGESELQRRPPSLRRWQRTHKRGLPGQYHFCGVPGILKIKNSQVTVTEVWYSLNVYAYQLTLGSACKLNAVQPRYLKSATGLLYEFPGQCRPRGPLVDPTESSVVSIVTFYYRGLPSLCLLPHFEPFVNVRSLPHDPIHRTGACLLKSGSLVGVRD